MATTAAPPFHPQNTQNNAENNSDVFSMTDDGLARRFQFQKEHGVGNWGSVWVAADKRDADKREEDREKVAIKVVHRSKTQTTAARVRALWNEMKSVRSLRNAEGEGHPSVVNFDCFIITPSYALIVMEFLPTPLTVPVDEQTAKPWMASLASAVEFMHSRGVVHNDIKPANILLSIQNVPTLVDFGFSERYSISLETENDTDDIQPSPHGPFLSSLAYGTPEYLSPERAAGLVHDTRKADVWSLGLTFFELIFSRTPFEEEKALPNKEDAGNDNVDAATTDKKAMDAYWARTVKGKWLGAGSGGSKLRGKISVPLEALLRRMISPNADVRYTATQVLRDRYWDLPLTLNGDKTITTDKEKTPRNRVLKKAGAPIVHIEPPTPQPQTQSGMAGVMRTVLGNKGNVISTAKALALPVKGDGKENIVPKSSRMAQGDLNTRPQVQAKHLSRVEKTAIGQPEESVESQSLLVEQEAQRVREVAADTHVDRMAIWVKNVERVVEDAKKTIVRGDSQVLPPLPHVPGVESPSKSLVKPSNAPLSPSHPRRRANEIFAPPSAAARTQRHRRPVAIGNSADLNAPVQTLRHTVSADYPFNGRAVDGMKAPNANVNGQQAGLSDGVKVVLSRPEIRKIKSDLASSRGLHARTPSYNSMYLRQAAPPPVSVIPEVRIEDADDESHSPVPQAAKESFYDQLIVSSNIVERIGKGYQSNLCTQNGHGSTSRRNSAYNPPPPCINANGERVRQSVKRKLSASNFFLSVRGERSCDADEKAGLRLQAAGVATSGAVDPARPRRKVRQTASLDGFGGFARPQKEKPTQARPVSEHIPPETPPSTHGVVKVEKKRSTVTKTVRRAFLAFIGSGVEKTN